MLPGELRTKKYGQVLVSRSPPEFCLSVGNLFGREGDELLAVREAAQGAQALLALQASLVL
jgi:hypothetical protein